MSAKSHTVLLTHPTADLYGSDRVFMESVSALVAVHPRVVVALPVRGPLVAELTRRGAQVEICETPVLRKSMLSLRGFGRLSLVRSHQQEGVMPQNTTEEIDGIVQSSVGIGDSSDHKPYVSNHTGYGKGGENFEHDDTGALMNYSGIVDDVGEAQKEHEGWQEGYDY